MQYFSTNRKSPAADFEESVLSGQPDDKGLYFPESVPQLSRDFISSLDKKSNEQIAYEVIRPYVGGKIVDEALQQICAETISFSFPVVKISPRISALELFHGPTLAFKDVGARFMSRCLAYFSHDRGEKTVVVVATSGDTGGAVAAGFHGMEAVEVVILYPKGKVSRIQERQLTSLGGNVTTLELRGTFDNCQTLAKQALADPELKKRARVTSANSINIARWLPQQFYYFFAAKEFDGEPPAISVPSGNFGNLAAGLLAQRSGLPVERFIAACNSNDVVPQYLATGQLHPRHAVPTLSNAMDVGDPSNWVRVMEIFGNDLTKLTDKLVAASVSDERTRRTMREVYEKTGYVLDPHGAVGYHALEEYLDGDNGGRGVFLATAHPIKFDSVREIIGNYGAIHESIGDLGNRPKHKIEIAPEYQALKEILLSKT
ncbi:MAG: threonine synthase [Acidobacteria bacterium]|nr:threonine synthase [Acidobacteriota bacterium]